MSDAEFVQEFLVESYENLDRLDQDLIVLEKDPGNRETLASIFRTIHTIKGTSGFLAFHQLEAVTHVGENLLSRLRDGLLTLTAEITTALLAMVDAVRQMLGSIDSTGGEGERNDQELISILTRLLQQEAMAAPEPVPTSPAKTEAAPSSPPPAAPPQPARNIGDILVSQGVVKRSEIHAAIEQQNAGDPRHLGEILVAKGVVSPQDVVEALNTQQLARAQTAGDSTIRVDVSQLDRLMNRVGELVLLRNQIVQYTHASDDTELLGSTQRLNLLTTELQEGVMKTRMQPIGNIWSKFPRTVRDVAMSCGKQVRIEMEGKETELDKTIIEAIKDPLTHLVRNAVDHGIEAPAARQAAGKDPEGRLFLRAFHEGGQVNIEITDDGVGLNYERIRAKALEKALITADQAARMSEREITNLVLLPGFSTAEKITNVSGRGVGMDVVKTNIEKIGGTVDLQSKPGAGCSVRMKIPLTLAIIPALIVTTAGDRYAIPQVSLLELVRLEGEQMRKGLELVNGAPVHRLRGRLLPLVYLRRELKTEAESSNATQSANVNIVVLRADDRQFGLVVDEINDTEEIVVKPLSKCLKSIRTYAGATIMGDGKVALILDVLGLAQGAGVIGEIRDRAVTDGDPKHSLSLDESRQRNSVLLFEQGAEGRMAIDLALVARLEEFARDAIEIAAGREVVQYRGQIMPLLRIADIVESRGQKARENESGSLHVVVYSGPGSGRDFGKGSGGGQSGGLSGGLSGGQNGGQSGGQNEEKPVGLVVDRIVDIVEESFSINPHSARPGILGSAVIQKRVTDIVDVPALIAAANRHQSPAQV